MKSRTSFILKTMNIIFWIIFIGLCIKTGTILISFLVSLFVNSIGAGNLHSGLDLSGLYAFDVFHYFLIGSLIIILTGFKAYIAFLVVKIFIKFNFSDPFNRKVTFLISEISYVALGTGMVALTIEGYCGWLLRKGIAVSKDWGSGEILLFAGVIYIITQVFKRGTELQAENELTV